MTTTIQLPENRKVFEVNFKSADFNEEQRLVTGFISTIDPDMIGDVVLPEAMDDQTYFASTRSVNLNHEESLPIGTNRNLSVKNNGIYALTYISKSALGTDVWTMMKEGVIRGWSIEWDPRTLKWEAPSENQAKQFGTKCRRVFKQFTLTSYAAVPQPMNPHCLIDGFKSASYLETMDPIWKKMESLFTEGRIHKSSAVAAGFPERKRVFVIPETVTMGYPVLVRRDMVAG